MTIEALIFILNIYGNGPEKDTIKYLANTLNIKQNVRFKGYSENKNKIYSNADLFINASIFEGLPNALVETINYGVFPICSNSPGGNMEVIMNGKLGSYFKLNDDDIIVVLC